MSERTSCRVRVPAGVGETSTPRKRRLSCVKGCQETSTDIGENPDNNQLWLYASSLERSTQDMCDYIDDIMKLLVGYLYYKGYVEMIF